MKNQQRKIALERRKSQSKQEVLQASSIICDRLADYLHGTIALYKSYGKEVCVDSLFDLYPCGLPVVDGEGSMHFVRYHQNMQWKIGAYGIKEPDSDEIMSLDDFDVMVIPMVAFDAQCHRLGHGKGYYDRYLQNFKGLKIGVALDIQKLDHIIVDTYDIPMDLIITQSTIYKKES